MSNETPQRCPTCNSVAPKVRGETYHDRRGFLEICGDPFHTAPVPAPEPAICLHCGIIIGSGRNRLCDTCFLSVINGPCSKSLCEHDLAKTKPAAAIPSGNNLAIGGESEANITEREAASPEPPRDEYPNPANAGKMTSIDLIEWLAQIANDCSGDWGWIKDELLRRIPEPAAASTGTCESCGGRAAEELYGLLFIDDDGGDWAKENNFSKPWFLSCVESAFKRYASAQPRWIACENCGFGVDQHRCWPDSDATYCADAPEGDQENE